MMRWFLGFFLAYFLSAPVVQAADIHVVNDKAVVDDFNGFDKVFESNKNVSVKVFVVYNVLGFCTEKTSGDLCTSQRLLIAIQTNEEVPAQALYRTDEMDGWEFVRWASLPRRHVTNYNRQPVVFEAKARKYSPGGADTYTKYVISVTPWSAKIEVVK